MPRPLIAALALLAACNAEHLEIGASTDPIIGGTASPPNAFPTTGVMLFVLTDQGGQFGSMICTGTLIAPDVVLTAAHCVDETFFPQGNLTYYFSFAPDVSTFGQQNVNLPPTT